MHGLLGLYHASRWAKTRSDLDMSAPLPGSSASPLGFSTVLMAVGGIAALFGLLLHISVLMLAGVPLLGVGLLVAVLEAVL